jgi:tetratricopeptide (TPR) repeat protein
MNNTHSSKRGHVVPKWLEFSNALEKGELVIPRRKPFGINEYTKKNIEAELKEFKQTPSIENALSLLGAAIVIGDKLLEREMATFIKRQKGASKTSLELVDKILNPDKSDPRFVEVNLRIAEIKNWINKYPKNAISWIQLARLYTINGQFEKAKKAAKIALNLAPFDRYVVRCGVRFFLHILDFDSASHYIHKANLYVHDPWLKATEINVSMIANKRTPSFKKLLPRDPSRVDLFHYSELYESYGILELEEGNYRSAKKLFKTAWTKPCETVITHGEWVIRNKLPGLRENSNLDYEKSLEALTWVRYFNLDLKNAIKTAKEWELEEPYSRSPFILGTSIACNAGMPDMGAEISLRGLNSNPDDPKLINNLCYSLLKAGRVEEAEENFKNSKQRENDEEKIFYLATKGLLEFKKGNVASGRSLYSEAIKLCKQKDERDLAVKAYLNLALAELEASTHESIKTVRLAISVSKNYNDPDIVLLRQQIFNNLEKKKSKKSG